MTHPNIHGGWARAAYSRGESYLACTLCGQPKHPRRQAGPREAEPQMPVVRLVNYFLSAVVLWMFVIGWGLTLIEEAGLV